LYDGGTYFPQRIEIGNGGPARFVPNRNIFITLIVWPGDIRGNTPIYPPAEDEHLLM
jgi:hypothetical protein